MRFLKCFLLGVLCFLSCFAYAQADSMMYYKMWGSIDGRHDYQVAVFKLAMELTAEEYPPYVLTQVHQSFGSARGRREIANGDKINFYVAPMRAPSDYMYKEVTAIQVPIMKGLLGYRKLVVHQDQAMRFADVDTMEKLKTFRVGQARGWPDVEIYKHNGFPVEANANFGDLFTMLTRGRFDYLPLGVMEADRILETHAKDYTGMQTLESIYLYYPHPVVFQVSAKERVLIARLTKGLERAADSGQLDALFEHYFSDYLALLSQNHYRLFVLENPRLESTMGLSEPLLSLSH